MKRALVFPGQGSQYVGMGKDLYEGHQKAKELFQKADTILSTSLSSICFEGPEQILKQTYNTQPAIFLHSVVVLSLLENLQFDMVAGHSLGEYSALVAAGALTFEDGLKLVRLRGELMQKAGNEQPGTMAAIIGLDSAIVEEICHEASSLGVVQPANFNSPGQVVISGSVVAVQKAMEFAKQRGAKMTKELAVSGAFHSPLMESAVAGLAKGIAQVTINDAKVPVYSNVTAKPVCQREEIKDVLLKQLTHSVRWEEIIVNMIADGVTEFIEVGPGKVLQGLIKRINPNVAVRGVEKLTDIFIH